MATDSEWRSQMNAEKDALAAKCQAMLADFESLKGSLMSTELLLKSTNAHSVHQPQLSAASTQRQTRTQKHTQVQDVLNRFERTLKHCIDEVTKFGDKLAYGTSTNPTTTLSPARNITGGIASQSPKDSHVSQPLDIVPTSTTTLASVTSPSAPRPPETAFHAPLPSNKTPVSAPAAQSNQHPAIEPTPAVTRSSTNLPASTLASAAITEPNSESRNPPGATIDAASQGPIDPKDKPDDSRDVNTQGSPLRPNPPPPSPTASVDALGASSATSIAERQRKSTNHVDGATSELSPLRYDQLGDGLVEHLADKMKHPSFAGVIPVEGLPKFDWGSLMSTIVFEDESVDCSRMSYVSSSQDGIAYLQRHDKAKIKWPDFAADPGPKPTTEEITAYLNDLTENPPKRFVHYYGGPPPKELEGLLHPGKTLANRTRLPFITTTYLHAGKRNSGTTDHIEDSNLRSMNLTLCGYKIWRLIPPSHRDRFEAFVKREWPDHGDCHNFVRHIAALISPKRLEEEGIQFRILCTGPGDLVTTEPYEYHQCVNWSVCLAVSINFLLPGEQLFALVVPTCDLCGLFSLVDEEDNVVKVPPPPDTQEDVVPANRLKRAATEDSAERERKVTRVTRSTTELLQLRARIRKVDKYCKLPVVMDNYRPDTFDPFSLAAYVQSRIAIRQFVELVKAQRNEDGRMEVVASEGEDALDFQIRAIIRDAGNTHLQMLRLRIRQCYLASEVEKSIPGWGVKADSTVLDQKAERWGMDGGTLRQHYRLGKRWMKYEKRYPGILPFIFISATNPFTVGPSSFTTCSEKEVEEFLDLLDEEYMTWLGSAGKMFEEALMGSRSAISFVWEEQDVDLITLPEEDMKERLKVQ